MEDYAALVKLTSPFGANDKFLQISNEFSEANATPEKNGGSRITRHQLNGLGYLATIGTYLERCGYPCVYQGDIAYPKDAIVTKIEEVNGRTYAMEFRSRWDNNHTSPPSIASGVSIFDYQDQEQSSSWGWEPIYNFPSFNFFPDYNNRKLLSSQIVAIGSEDIKYQKTITIDEPGWVYIVRTYDAWDSYPDTMFLNGVKISFKDYNEEEETIDFMRPYEGPIATRFFPPPQELIISGMSGTGHVWNATTKKYDIISGNLKIDVYLFPLEDWE